MRKIILSVVLGVLILSVSAVYAKEPVLNISPKRHNSIAEAQSLSRQAYDKIVIAQRANEYDMEGHAQKAKKLLEQVNAELKLAAQAANQNRYNRRR